MRLVFLGAPGVGKGTQADRVSELFKIAKISTGDLLRGAVRNKTKLGLEAKGYMDQGKLVPDSVVIGLVREKLSEPGCLSGFVLDGFPRTIPQADELGRVLEEKKMPLDRVVNFEVPRETIVKRLTGRRSCPNCHATYHVDFSPPKKADVCDRCGESLVQRSDDRREAIETRLKVYEEQTTPLIRYYGEKHLLSHLDASDSVDAVFAKLTKVLELYRGT